ncbi:threonine transporter [Vibrio nigripulchritudo]|uniref:LysE family translocator n=1 Tax=Vibrio nigripulchritudo TaxID=28173 RepID=UPI001909A0A3|nr:LysE family translocator [Vibrio nigripulchritudo]BCL71597.1 threonine transporter [Vibrio nigripulchritudo]BDU32954.1 threonine transporter [Vibrio nigripulchritudo]
MNELTLLLTLATVHFIALLSPGPDFALVVQNASRHGRQTGIYIALGLSVGILLHSVFSLTGVSYLVHQHPNVFRLLQLAGGSYLLYLGIGALRYVIFSFKSHQPSDDIETSLILANRKQAFVRGFITNILNPKALVFFVSLMSSLVPASMSLTGKGFALLILWGLSFFWFSLLAWVLSAQRFQAKLKQAALYIDALCGLVFTGIGISILYQVA